MKWGPRLLSVSGKAPRCLLSLTEGAIHVLECFKDHVGILSDGCVSCGQGVKLALWVSMAPRGHFFI